MRRLKMGQSRSMALWTGLQTLLLALARSRSTRLRVTSWGRQATWRPSRPKGEAPNWTNARISTRWAQFCIASSPCTRPSQAAERWVKRHQTACAVLAGFAVLLTVSAVAVTRMWLELRGTAATFYDKSQALVLAGRFQEALSPIEYAIRLEGENAEYRYF